MRRKHQAEFENIIDQIIRHGAGGQTVLLKVTPGGGKSAIPIIAGKLIREKLAQRLCWVAPRKALQSQGERNFLDPFFRELFDHDLTIRASTNETNPARNLDGFITTYQAISQDKDRLLEFEFFRYKYILILDEVHHVEDLGVWHEALKPLVELCEFIILMTGTIERGDGSKIAFLNYDGDVPDLQSKKNYHVIEYTRADALAEKAIIPLSFKFHDGQAVWENEIGDEVKVKSLAKARRQDIAAAIYTAISTQYARQLLSIAVDHWIGIKKKNPRSKLLIVTANLNHAKIAFNFLYEKKFSVNIATSHESAQAQAAIDAFKKDEIDILVTIAMAYEGLDVPAITHIVCLTHIRSRPWLEQMLARANRIDRLAGPYSRQRAFVFSPDDPLFREVVEKIRSEQLPFVNSGEQMELFKTEQELEKDYQCGDCVGFEACVLNDNKNYLDEICDRFEKSIKPPMKIKPKSSAVTDQRDLVLAAPGAAAPEIIQTPKEREKELRAKIERHVRAFSHINRYENGKVNGELFKYFQKPRGEMTIPELENVLKFIELKYPVNLIERGRGKRVSSRVVPWGGS